MLYRFRWLSTADTRFFRAEWRWKNPGVNAEGGPLAGDEVLVLRFGKLPWRKRQINLAKTLCLLLIRLLLRKIHLLPQEKARIPLRFGADRRGERWERHEVGGAT